MENYDVIVGPHVNQNRGLQRGLHNWEDVLHVGRKGGDGKRNGESLRERERERDMRGSINAFNKTAEL